jgi:hypothetical protein
LLNPPHCRNNFTTFLIFLFISLFPWPRDHPSISTYQEPVLSENTWFYSGNTAFPIVWVSMAQTQAKPIMKIPFFFYDLFLGIFPNIFLKRFV